MPRRHLSLPEPRWRRADLPGLPGLAACRHWLLDDGSLTERLRACGGRFSVQRLRQGWQLPLPSEQQLLGLQPRQQALVREVALRLDGVAVVFARSVFPYHSLTGPLGHLRQLQNTSLGAILFGRPDMRRSPFELARLPAGSGYLHPAVANARAVWGRRSVFVVAGRPLLVSEVFLETFRPWPRETAIDRNCRGRVSAAILRGRSGW